MDTQFDGQDSDPRRYYFPEALMQDEIAKIAEQVLWNASKVSSIDVQKLAAAVVAHLSLFKPTKDRVGSSRLGLD